MKYSQLPSTIYENGKIYFLISRELNDSSLGMKGWWSFEYSESNDEVTFPAEATDGWSTYYLISVEKTKKEAQNSLLEKLNETKEILTEKRKKEIMKMWEDKNKKFKKK